MPKKQKMEVDESESETDEMNTSNDSVKNTCQAILKSLKNSLLLYNENSKFRLDTNLSDMFGYGIIDNLITYDINDMFLKDDVSYFLY